MHHNPNYTEEELNNIESMLLSPNEASLDLALELIKNNGFHYQLERPLALLALIQPDVSYEVQNRIEKIYKSRIDTIRRAGLRKELALAIDCFEHNFENTSDKGISSAIDLFQLLYGSYINGRQHLLDAFYEIARTLRREEKSYLAQRCFLSAINWKSTHQNTFFELGLLYQNDLEQLPEAVTAYLKAIELESSDYVAHNNLGQVYEAMGKISAAEKHLEIALSIQPSYIHSIINLAYLRWRHQPRYEEAYELYESALQIAPYDTFALCNFSELLMVHFEEFERAKQYLEKSLEIEVDDEEAWRLLGDLSLLGPKPNIAQAKSYYQKALYYKPDDEKTLLKLEKLDNPDLK